MKTKYIENINLIRKLVWSFHRTTGLDWDDLFQEAALAYYEGEHNYDPMRGEKTTFMWCLIVSRLTDYTRDEKVKDVTLCDLIEANWMSARPEPFWERIPMNMYKPMEQIMHNAQMLDSFSPEDARKYTRVLLFKAGYTREQVRLIMKGLENIISKH
jgi:DNA-directed RNA polymerase specialized sigma24 family protein